MNERIPERIHDMICNMLHKRMHVGVITWIHDRRIRWTENDSDTYRMIVRYISGPRSANKKRWLI